MSAFSEPASARQEAERLVAAIMAAAAVAANANPHWSTGSAECCVCPLCKVIAAVRDPDPEMVERVATGAGDLAAGVASFLRHVASPSASQDAWHSATRSATEAASEPEAGPETGPETGRETERRTEQTPPPARKMVKKAVKKADPKKAG